MQKRELGHGAPLRSVVVGGPETRDFGESKGGVGSSGDTSKRRTKRGGGGARRRVSPSSKSRPKYDEGARSPFAHYRVEEELFKFNFELDDSIASALGGITAGTAVKAVRTLVKQPGRKRRLRSPKKGRIGLANDGIGAFTSSTSLSSPVASGAVDVSDVVSTLKTGVDAISFFAEYGNSTSIKFIHLNKADTGDEFRPYDLVVVPQDKVHSEHYVMSNLGVTKIPAKRSKRHTEPTEFTPLSRWVREVSMFNVLRSLNTFKNYLLWKMLGTWRSNVRHATFCRQRDRINRELFLLKPAFSGAMRDILAFKAHMTNQDHMLLSFKFTKVCIA